jgi:hypothetical protein
MALAQIAPHAHATCFGMPPEVAHVVIGLALLLVPMLAAAVVVLLVRLGRQQRAQDKRIAAVEALAERHDGLWNGKLFGARDADLRARALHRR